MKNIFIMAFISVGLFACGSAKDSDKIGDAQLCLDKLGASAPASEVNSCLEKIDGLESAAAYGLRCAGSFMKEGFLDPEKLINAMDQLNGGSTTNFIGLITFSSAGVIATDTSNAYKAFDYCLKGEGKGSTLISSFGYLGMALYQFLDSQDNASCDDAPGATGYDFDECLTNFTDPGNGQAVANALTLAQLGNEASGVAAVATLQSSIGAVLISTANISCSTRQANQDLCTMVNNAVTAAGGISNPRLVAKHFLTGLLN